MTTMITDRTATTNGHQTRAITLDHLTAIPRFIWIAQEVAHAVYSGISHDRLEGLSAVEIGELLDGPEPMLNVVWQARWNDGHVSRFKFMVPEPYAEEHHEKIAVSMEHRLMREVYREDTYLAM